MWAEDMLNLLRVVGIVFVLIGLSLVIAGFGVSLEQLAVVSAGRVTIANGEISMPPAVALIAGSGLVLLGIVCLYYSRNRNWRLVQ